MPIHDWNRVEAGMFHDFHNAWITELRNALNGGLLPDGYYALGEQHTGHIISDILTLHSGGPNGPSASSSSNGGTAVAQAPPRIRRQLTGTDSARQRRRTVAIRHVSGHRLVAMIEIISPSNKDRLESVESFAAKTVEALEFGIHVLLIDILRPGVHDPRGMHWAVWKQFEETPYDLPIDEPLTLASYRASRPVKAFLEHRAIGGELPDMPLFLNIERYIEVPLEATYQAAYRGVPAYWREVIEGRR